MNDRDSRIGYIRLIGATDGTETDNQRFDRSLDNPGDGFSQTYVIINHTQKDIEVVDTAGRVIQLIPSSASVRKDPKSNTQHAPGSSRTPYLSSNQSNRERVIVLLKKKLTTNGVSKETRLKISIENSRFGPTGHVMVEDLNAFIRFASSDITTPVVAMGSWLKDAFDHLEAEQARISGPFGNTNIPEVSGSTIAIIHNAESIYDEFVYTTNRRHVIFGPCIRSPYLNPETAYIVWKTYLDGVRSSVVFEFNWQAFRSDIDQVIHLEDGHPGFLGEIIFGMSPNSLEHYLEKLYEEDLEKAQVSEVEHMQPEDVPINIRTQIISETISNSPGEIPGIVLDYVDRVVSEERRTADERFEAYKAEMEEALTKANSKLNSKEELLKGVNEELNYRDHLLKTQRSASKDKAAADEIRREQERKVHRDSILEAEAEAAKSRSRNEFMKFLMGFVALFNGVVPIVIKVSKAVKIAMAMVSRRGSAEAVI